MKAINLLLLSAFGVAAYASDAPLTRTKNFNEIRMDSSQKALDILNAPREIPVRCSMSYGTASVSCDDAGKPRSLAGIKGLRFFFNGVDVLNTPGDDIVRCVATDEMVPETRIGMGTPSIFFRRLIGAKITVSVAVIDSELREKQQEIIGSVPLFSQSIQPFGLLEAIRVMFIEGAEKPYNISIYHRYNTERFTTLFPGNSEHPTHSVQSMAQGIISSVTEAAAADDAAAREYDGIYAVVAPPAPEFTQTHHFGRLVRLNGTPIEADLASGGGGDVSTDESLLDMPD